MNSLSTVDQANLDNYLEVVRNLDPELYFIKIALHETKVNPIIVTKIIRALHNLTLGAGYGKVQIHMQARVITNITGEENVKVNERASIE